METIAWVQTIVLLLTAVILYLYTLETAALRREAVHQRHIQLRPVVTPEFPRDTQQTRQLVLHNIGAGTAFNVRVEPIIHTGGFTWEHSFDLVPYIEPAGDVTVTIRQKIDGEPHSSEWSRCSFMPQFTTTARTLDIKFEDVEGGRYSLSVRIYPPAKIIAPEGRYELGPIRHTQPQVHGLRRFFRALVSWYTV